MGHVNINPVRNNFAGYPLIVKRNVDILMISGTKLDDSFPTAQLLLHGFIASDRPSNYFQQNNVFETILPDFHRIVVTELKMGLQKLKLHLVAYGDFKHFDDSEKF